MTDIRSVSSEVEVGADPATAFLAFTEELDLWWVRGPINFWSDAHRVIEVRCEPGVGGRIMEILDSPDSGEVFVRARIAEWEPPERLCFDSAQDDVSTEVTFTPTTSGTLVRVLHSVPAGGDDNGGTSWSRVVPRWFGDSVGRRDRCPPRGRRRCSAVLGRLLRQACSRPRTSWPEPSDSRRLTTYPRRNTIPTSGTATTGSSSASATRCFICFR